MKKFLYIVSLLLLWVIVGCGHNEQSTISSIVDDELLISVQQDENIRTWNQYFKIDLDPSIENDLKPDSDVYVRVENQSNKEIWFPLNREFRIFELKPDQQSRTEIKNEIEYTGKNTILSPKAKGIYLTTEFVIPGVTNKKEATLVRIFMIGYISNNGEPTDEKVGAYFDVTIKP